MSYSIDIDMCDRHLNLIASLQTTEAANEVLQVIRRNNHLEELHMKNIGAKW